MRLKNAAFFAVGFLSVSFWLHGSARCQGSARSPLSLAPPPSATDQAAPPASTCHWGGLNLWCNNPASPGVSPPRSTAKGSPVAAPDVPTNPPPVIPASPPVAAESSPPAATKNVLPPTTADDVSPRPATAKSSARSAAAKNSPPPAKNAPAPAADNILPSPGVDSIVPTPRVRELSPSQEPGPDGFTVGIDDGEETGQPVSRPRPAKHSKVRQRPDAAKGAPAIQPLDDDAEVERLKPKLTICRGC